jgi:hypothetical protein
VVIEILAVVFLGLGVAEFVAWLAIVFNYSVNASVWFRVVMTVLKAISMTSALVIAYLAFENLELLVLGLDAINWLVIFVVSQLAIRWMLNIYVIVDIWQRR